MYRMETRSFKQRIIEQLKAFKEAHGHLNFTNTLDKNLSSQHNPAPLRTNRDPFFNRKELVPSHSNKTVLYPHSSLYSIPILQNNLDLIANLDSIHMVTIFPTQISQYERIIGKIQYGMFARSYGFVIN